MAHTSLLGHLASKNPPPPPRILQWDYTYGPMVFLGGGRFIMCEVPLYLQGNGGGASSGTKKIDGFARFPRNGFPRDAPSKIARYPQQTRPVAESWILENPVSSQFLWHRFWP